FHLLRTSPTTPRTRLFVPVCEAGLGGPWRPCRPLLRRRIRLGCGPGAPDQRQEFERFGLGAQVLHVARRHEEHLCDLAFRESPREQPGDEAHATKLFELRVAGERYGLIAPDSNEALEGSLAEDLGQAMVWSCSRRDV